MKELLKLLEQRSTDFTIDTVRDVYEVGPNSRYSIKDIKDDCIWIGERTGAQGDRTNKIIAIDSIEEVEWQS